MATANSKTLSSNTCCCYGTNHNSSTSSRCSRCSSRPRSPLSGTDCPAIEDRNKNYFLHLGPTGPNGGAVNGIDPLAQEIDVVWEAGEKLPNLLKHEVPKFSNKD